MPNAPYKVLVLGAGASYAYGYPLGGEIRQAILRLSEDDAKQAGIIHPRSSYVDRRNFLDFQNAFNHSQMYSIDAFLGRRRTYADIGKKCIATVLLAAENADSLFLEDAKRDHWYQYFFNQIARKEWDELTFDDIAIVSFNYDRSLEHFLYVALQSTYRKSAEQVASKLQSIRLIHVYGALCNELPLSEEYIRYDGEFDARKVDEAAKGLIVIPEGRTDSDTLVTAREWLSGASSICFLGFGFDPINVERLAENSACRRLRPPPQIGLTIRDVYGTYLGMTKAEAASAYNSLTGGSFSEADGSRFISTTCTQLLRETLFLK